MGVDAFTLAWNKRSHVYLFPARATYSLLQVVHHLWTVKGMVLHSPDVERYGLMRQEGEIQAADLGSDLQVYSVWGCVAILV